MQTRAEIEALAKAEALTISGVVYSTPEKPLPDGAASLILLSPNEPWFWPHFRASAEAQDGDQNPVDRWSVRIITQLATKIGGTAFFPFGPPPYHPFYSWALESGETHVSPVALLTSIRTGLFTSFRGAITLPYLVERRPLPSPCTSCAATCLTACPAGALGPTGYDVPKCHAFLDTAAGAECLSRGCLARRSCPAGHARLTDQSAHHMSYFHR